MWFHPAKELKAYCTISPHKANNLKGFKPLGARISWSVVGASILAPAGAGFSLPSLLPVASWVYGIHSLSLLLSSLQTFTTFSLHPSPRFTIASIGSLQAPALWIWGCSVLWEHGSFPKSSVWLSPVAAAPWTGGVSGTCCLSRSCRNIFLKL